MSFIAKGSRYDVALRVSQRKEAILSSLLLCFGVCGMNSFAQAQPAATTTQLVLTVAGVPVSTTPAGSVLTLTAAVNSQGPVTRGQVDFCDTNAASQCTGIHLVGSAQLTDAGAATLKLRPGIGTRSYSARFRGTASDAASESAALTLSVSGSIATTTSLQSSGAAGSYTINAKVTGHGNPLQPLSPFGSVALFDQTNGNTALGSATLGSPVYSVDWNSPSSPSTGITPTAVATADFNGDGIPDMAVTGLDAPETGYGIVTILIGNGDGTFVEAAKSAIPVGSEPTYIAAADMNRDGIPDLVIANFDFGRRGRAAWSR